MDFDVVFNWQMYVALGLVLMIIEAFVVTFFLFPIGAALLAVALVAPFVSLEIELVVFALLVLINFYISLKIVKPRFAAKNSLTGFESLKGRVTTVIEDINEDQGTGYVKVFADEWKALPSEMGQVLPKGTKVQIDRVDGNKVFVSKIDA